MVAQNPGADVSGGGVGMRLKQDEVVYIINGNPVTKSDILDIKKDRQRRLLSSKRNVAYHQKPCFVWTFYNTGVFYGGWHLYVKTLKNSWQIGPNFSCKLALKIMSLFPCGYLPLLCNFEQWQEAFAETYHYPTKKRPDKNGMAFAWAEFSQYGELLDVIRPGCRHRSGRMSEANQAHMFPSVEDRAKEAR
jgi:hypothetical protein